jgi:hypothetical protein
MKVVGEAFKYEAQTLDSAKRTVVLGITNFRSVTNYDTLISKNVTTKTAIKLENKPFRIKI